MLFKNLFSENSTKEILDAKEAHKLTTENIEKTVEKSFEWAMKVLPKVESEIKYATKIGQYSTSISFLNKPQEYLRALSRVLEYRGYSVVIFCSYLKIRW